MNNYTIFKYLKPRENDKISNFKGLDLQDILNYINEYLLEFRNSLNFDDFITFGLEFEFEKANFERITSFLKNQKYNNWNLTSDDTLTCYGGEIQSPILTDTTDNWQKVKNLCIILRNNATIDNTTGSHVHVGSQILKGKSESFYNFLKIWRAYENIIYRFSYGEFLNKRELIDVWAEPIKDKLDYMLKSKFYLLDYKCALIHLSQARLQAVSFQNVSNLEKQLENNTIEFRTPNGTLNPIIWQNNVNFFVKLLLYCTSPKFDKHLVEKRYKQIKNLHLNLDFYGEIYLKQCLELADMIFDNNLDKIYFLRQYLKSFETSDAFLKPSKKFTL